MNDTRLDDIPLPMETQRPRFVLLGMFIIVCCVAFLVVDVVTPHAFHDAFPAIICLNIVTTQLTVICIWGTLVRGTFWIRLPWTLLLLIVSWFAIAWGIARESGLNQNDAVFGAGLMWFFGFVVSFVPLKMAALFFRWQIIQPSDSAQLHTKKYAIRDVMIGTLLLALAMAVGTAILPDDPVTFQAAVQSSGLNRTDNLFAVSLFGVISLLVKLPCIWIAFAAPFGTVVRSIVVWSVYCFVLTIVELVLLSLFIGTAALDDELFSALVVGHQVMGATMLAVCLPLRGLGYRMERSISVPGAAV